MDRVFSVEEIANPFWQPPPPIDDPKMMNRSSSEWSFQRFLQEVDPLPPAPVVLPSLTSSSSSCSIPSDDNQAAFFKRKLDLACAAVALTRASMVKPQDSASLADNASHVSDIIQSGHQTPQKGSGISFLNEPDKVVAAPLAIPALPVMQKQLGTQIRPATSTSSREQSDDEDIEDETEITDSMDPADVKRVRRKLSNRESARRSRRRKQAHMSELETQVAQLRVEKSSLLKRFSDVSQKYNGAAVDNRVLKADLEALRTKVKMAEGAVKRAAGLNPMFQGMSEIPNMCMPFSGNISTNIVAPIQEHPNQHFYQQVSDNLQNSRVVNNDPLIPPPIREAQNSSGSNKMGRTPSMQQVADLEHSQKRICGGAISDSVQWDSVWDQEDPPALDDGNRQSRV